MLHVDDEEQPLKEVRDYLRTEDLGGWGPPEITALRSFDEALAELERTRYDLVILDVRAGGHQPADFEGDDAGRELLRRIQERRYVPVVFFTAIAGAVEDLKGHSVRVVRKPDGAEALVEQVRDVFETRLPVVNRALVRFIEHQQRDYMWTFVDAHWDELGVEVDHTAVAYLLARRIGRSLPGPLIAALAATLGEAPGPLASGDRAHPIELYVIPPIADVGFLLGDLFEGEVADDNAWWLLLSPSCDLQPGRIKAKRVLLARCDLLKGTSVYTSGIKTNPASQNLRELLSNKTGGQYDRKLYLPRAAGIPDLVVDFQHLVTTPFETLDTLSHVATLDSPFAEAALNRFERYYGRIGTQDLDIEVAVERMRQGS